MNLSSNVDSLMRENYFLRTATRYLLITTLVLAGIIFAVFDRQPILIERSSRGLEIVRAAKVLRNKEDINTAIKLMLRARFETDAISPELFLNSKQMVLREAEQKDIKSRGMNQSVIVRQIQLNDQEAIVDLDRVIAVGDVRSALKAKIRIAFEEESPNELNPYGLTLSLADPLETKEVKK